MAMNQFALNTVYNHYLTSYAPKSSSPFDTHKKSELRGVYNSIIKLNKESPLYLLEKSKETSEFAVNVKENARQLRNTIASLGGLNAEDMLGKKVASTSNENIAIAKFVGDSAHSDDIPTFDLEVLSLASPQVNTGNFLPNTSVKLPPDTYSFDIAINDLNYEFQFNIQSGDTNKDVQERLSRLISNSNLGITSSVMEDFSGGSALRLESSSTGTVLDGDAVFVVSDNNTSKTSGAVAYFGLSDISRPAADASFRLNGDLRSTSSNTFSVEKMYEITLTGISPTEGETAAIALKTDYESLTDNVGQLLVGYNSFLKAANEYSQKYPKAGHLVEELRNLSAHQKNDFDSFGLNVEEDGSIVLDAKLLSQNIEEEGSERMQNSVKDFTQSLLRKTQQISLNPMEYVNKTIVAYKNPARAFATPYITSAYSGMMFNSYC